MNKTQQSVVLAGLLALALAVSGCKSTEHDSGARGSSGAAGATSTDVNRDYGLPEGSSGSTGTSGGTGSGSASGSGATIQEASGASGSSGASGTSGTGTSERGTSSMQDDRGNTASIANVIPNSTVLAIEAVPRSSGITEGDSSMGASGAAGATGSSGAGESWRVTVRMDDGSTQVVTHSGTPDFRSGDRINVTGGAIQR